MEKNLYELMDWPRIETIIYSEEDHPHEILGAQVTDRGILIQTYMPTAEKVKVKLQSTNDEIDMEKVDEAGFFAVLLPRKRIPKYSYIVEYANKEVREVKDPYVFAPQITEKDTKKFNSGIHYTIYDKMGAHPMTIGDTKGVYFAVWAPNALRVSVVGDFNLWDGRSHQMRRLWDSGIFELFIPNLADGDLYKFEMKAKGGLVYLKADPYANAAQLRPDTASVVADISSFDWSDNNWLTHRKKFDSHNEPVNIYEVHIGSFRKPEEEGKEFYNYRELAPMIAEYVVDMGYTYIELMPVMEYPYDASWGYQVTGYYAPTSRYGTPEDFMYFINYMHEKKIGVILDWVPAHFPRDTFGLSAFDGTCLYEHQDPRKGAHPHWGTLIYNYGRPEVSNFLIANALFWVENYHVDGIRMDAVASMLYLDYGKQDNEWLPNMYGGNENLEAMEFLKHLNSIFHKREDGAILIAEESTAWPGITQDIPKEGFGFDYKWNMGWMNDFIGYMQYDPIERSYHHNELIFSMVYAYSEKFILCLSHDEVVHEKRSLLEKMPGEKKLKFANLRVAYGFMMAHPGKKLLFMGQEFGQLKEWNEATGLQWELMEDDAHKQMKNYVQALNKLYTSQPALYQLDYEEDGFEWINNISANENIIVFARKSKSKDDTLIVICNFSNVAYNNHKIGVPYPGKYKEIFNSDDAAFGGTGVVNPRVKMSKKDECDDRPNSLVLNVPPLGISMLHYSKAVEKVRGNKAAKEKVKDTSKQPKTTKSLKEELVEKIEETQKQQEIAVKTPEVTKKPAKAKKETAKAIEPRKATEPAKAEKETAKAIEPRKATEPAKAEKETAKAIEPAKATKPAKAEKETAKAIEPAKATEPAKAEKETAKAIEPAKATKPAKAEKETAKAIEPAKATKPAKAEKETAKAIEPAKATKPAKAEKETAKAIEPTKATDQTKVEKSAAKLTQENKSVDKPIVTKELLMEKASSMSVPAKEEPQKNLRKGKAQQRLNKEK